MKKTIVAFLVALCPFVALFSQTNETFYHTVTFPANYQIGDYIEFLKVEPIAASAAGNYEISLAYTRMNVAASATHLASISHYNPNVWREVGRVHANQYNDLGHSFTVDCNTQYTNSRFRVRAINTLGLTSSPITVMIKIRSINQTSSWSTLSVSGSDLTVDKFLPMTNEWNLYVGRPNHQAGAALAIKADINGNVGIGTATPTAKLAVNGNIRAKEVKVEAAPWPDYVFEEEYELPDLSELAEYIKTNKRLPGMPSAAAVEAEGVNLGEMNRLLLEKVEELTLHLIGKEQAMERQDKEILQLKKQLLAIERRLLPMEGK